MAHVENNVMSNDDERRHMYRRYVDDIFVMVDSETQLASIKTKLEQNSVLTYTYEVGNKKLPFLDVYIEMKDDTLQTSVHIKKTNKGDCMNYNGDCPEKYQLGVINTLLHRAYKISHNWNSFHQEVQRLKQVFTNNDFPMRIIDAEINKFINKIHDKEDKPKHVTHKLFYGDQMNKNYKEDE